MKATTYIYGKYTWRPLPQRKPLPSPSNVAFPLAGSTQQLQQQPQQPNQQTQHSQQQQQHHHRQIVPRQQQQDAPDQEESQNYQQLLQQREEENRQEVERLTAEIRDLKLQLLRLTSKLSSVFSAGMS